MMLTCIREKSKKIQRDRIEPKPMPRVPKTTSGAAAKKAHKAAATSATSFPPTSAQDHVVYEQEGSSEEEDLEDDEYSSILDPSTVSNTLYHRGGGGSSSSYGGSFAHEHYRVGSKVKSDDDPALSFSEVTYPLGAPRISGRHRAAPLTFPADL
jgi:hypothetical protein